jgi:hypothetical protein
VITGADVLERRERRLLAWLESCALRGVWRIHVTCDGCGGLMANRTRKGVS